MNSVTNYLKQDHPFLRDLGQTAVKTALTTAVAVGVTYYVKKHLEG